VCIAVYILNRAYTKSLMSMTPYEAWYKRKPKVKHFRVFGCVVHVKTISTHIRKLDDRSTQMVFFGYEDGSKAYRVYNPMTNKVHVTRDAVFEEERGWDWTEKKKEQDENCLKDPVFKIMCDSMDEEQLESEDITHPVLNENLGDPEEEVNSNSSWQRDNTNSDAREKSQQTPVRLRSLEDIYGETEPVHMLYLDVCLLGAEEPRNVTEAKQDENWLQAMREEIDSINNNQTWSLVEPVPGQRVIGLKWVYKIKKDSEDRVIKYKARLVAQGYVQQYGVDYEEVFAPVARMETIRMLMAIAVQDGWLFHHMDVKFAFLNGDLHEVVHVRQPPGFEIRGSENKVFKLHKALYGLKQAPRAWNSKLDSTLVSLGFEKSKLEHAVYKRGAGSNRVLVGVYVDDLIITGASETEIERFKSQMKERFQMSDLGLLSYYLGLEVQQTVNKITLSKTTFAKRILEESGMSECNSTKVPMETRLNLTKASETPTIDQTKYCSVVGSLRYLLHTRPDLTFAVGIVSRYMECPRSEHMAAVKQILRYIKGTIDLGCVYGKSSEVMQGLEGFSDSDLVGDKDDRKSTTGVIYFLGCNAISWISRKQKVVALSSCEAEYIAASTAACQGIWLESLRAGLLNQKNEVIKLNIDNNSAISLCKNPVFHDRRKHIDTRYHFIRENVESGKISVEHIETND
jgi:Reverse transcriptase (RNA-dependent DNA polymerase)